MYDLHIHSSFSIDSKTSMEEMVLAAIDKNLKTICFADTISLDYTVNNINLSFRIQDYIKNINKVKYRYMKDIEILAGLEIDMQKHLKDPYDEIINKHPFDYIVLSVSSLNGKSIYVDNFLADLRPDEAIYHYYKEVLESVKTFDNFDTLGLFDRIDYYLGRKDEFANHPELKDLIQEILLVLINKSKGIELNSSGLRLGFKNLHPKLEILSLYQKLGGEIITLASSAKNPNDIAFSYRDMEKILKDLGFKYFYIFRQRKKVPINIG